MTVSLALRGHPHASPATRDRLRRLAAAMGYRPNPLITASMAHLRAGRHAAYAGMIAFGGLGASPAGAAAGRQMQRAYLGAQRRAEALGYRIEWFALDDPVLDGARQSRILRARGILGAILAANCVVPAHRHLDWDGFALAAIGRTDVGHELHRTTGDYYGAVRRICQLCRDRGYRRIGLAITAEHDLAHQGLHRSALLGCQAEWPRRDQVPVLVTGSWAPAPFLQWARRHRPDVVICGSDDPLRWLRSAGIRVPGEIGLIRPHVTNRSLGIGGFLFDDIEIGAAAVDLVVEQLHHNERGLPGVMKRVLLPGRWFEGRTLRPPPSAP